MPGEIQAFSQEPLASEVLLKLNRYQINNSYRQVDVLQGAAS